ncbi:hypothetical protein GCM10010503_38760 [Streptomyces lucensis JCM 4490]|uniref:Uncharacterized protein n=1 Tax=Streptomyces lucensis JCM 4490 TaxID=1306176 RepID=A0A918MTF5_9ACTN|nr:hypothetical protein GCM10010503_38760 [Streptomyces lucensis JCM 4490]
MPCPSVITWCFEPARPRSTGEGPVCCSPSAAVEFGVKKNNHPVEDPDGLVYTARLPLSSAT